MLFFGGIFEANWKNLEEFKGGAWNITDRKDTHGLFCHLVAECNENLNCFSVFQRIYYSFPKKNLKIHPLIIIGVLRRRGRGRSRRGGILGLSWFFDGFWEGFGYWNGLGSLRSSWILSFGRHFGLGGSVRICLVGLLSLGIFEWIFCIVVLYRIGRRRKERLLGHFCSLLWLFGGRDLCIRLDLSRLYGGDCLRNMYILLYYFISFASISIN